MKTTFAFLLSLMLAASPADCKHQQLRGKLDHENWLDDNQRNLRKKKRHSSGKGQYRHVPPTQNYYSGPSRYDQAYYYNSYGRQYAPPPPPPPQYVPPPPPQRYAPPPPPPQYYSNHEHGVYNYNRYQQQHYNEHYDYMGGPYEWKQYCRDCNKACYGFECTLSCCHKHKPKPKPRTASCQDCSKPCYGDDCKLECCEPMENIEDMCYSCEENNPCAAENAESGEAFYSHCDPDRFIQCDESSECVELPMSLWDLLVSEHMEGGKSQ